LNSFVAFAKRDWQRANSFADMLVPDVLLPWRGGAANALVLLPV